MRFVLLERFQELTPGLAARAQALFPAHLELFEDHFPGKPLVPGVLLTESMCQTGGWLIAASCDFAAWPLLVRIDRANFRRLVAADTPLVLVARITGSRDDTFELLAEALVNGETVADARLLFKLFHFDQTDVEADQFRAWAIRTFAQLDGPAVLARAHA